MFQFAILIIILAMIISIFGLGRKKKTPPAGKKAPDPAPERLAAEEDLKKRLERLKRRTESVAEAIDQDPQRAANTLRRMMKE